VSGPLPGSIVDYAAAEQPSRKSLKTDTSSSSAVDAMLLSGQGEIAFVVIEAYQAQGIGTLLMRHLRVLARDAGLKALIAEVLTENIAILNVFGFLSSSQRAFKSLI
jgi:GNAT superfamily N-acetyltransferase